MAKKIDVTISKVTHMMGSAGMLEVTGIQEGDRLEVVFTLKLEGDDVKQMNKRSLQVVRTVRKLLDDWKKEDSKQAKPKKKKKVDWYHGDN